MPHFSPNCNFFLSKSKGPKMYLFPILLPCPYDASNKYVMRKLAQTCGFPKSSGDFRRTTRPPDPPRHYQHTHPPTYAPIHHPSTHPHPPPPPQTHPTPSSSSTTHPFTNPRPPPKHLRLRAGSLKPTHRKTTPMKSPSHPAYGARCTVARSGTGFS